MKKIIIIGGGISGLTAGIYAQKYGFESTIYEQNTITGGQCTGWNRQGYHIDNCIHWLTGTQDGTLMNELWKEVDALGENIKQFKPESFGVYEFDGQKVSIYNDYDKLKAELLRVAPEDKELIEDFMHDVALASGMDVPADKPVDMHSLPELMKLGMRMKDAGAILKKYGNISCVDYAKRFKNPLLQKVFHEMMPAYYSAQALIFSVATVINGNGNIPEGGSLAMSERMRKKYISLGGKVQTGMTATEIMVSGKQATGVKFADGTQVSADYVIAACDVKYTFETLLDNQFHDSEFESRFEAEKEQTGSYPVPTSAHVTFAVDMDMKDYPVSFVFETEKYQVGVSEFETLGVRNYSYESAFAPQGKAVLKTFISQWDKDYEWWEELYKDKMAYEVYKEELARKIQNRLEKRFPELVGKLSVIDVYTPITYHRYCNTYHGAWMSFVMQAGQKQLMHNGKIKGLGNCFLAGMWLQPPGGLPVAAVTGKYAVQRICKCEKIKL